MDGNVFLDCTAGIAVTATGHSHPDVVKAIVEQAGRFLHMSGTDFYYEPQVRLGEELSSIMPMPGPHRSFFGNSGPRRTRRRSSSLGITRSVPTSSRSRFVPRSHDGLALADCEQARAASWLWPFVPGVFHAPYANCYRCPVGNRPETCAAECLRFIEEQLLVHLVHPTKSPPSSSSRSRRGRYVVPPDVFHQRLARITTRHGMLLVVDEVQSGMGRTGKIFAIEHAGVQPDVVTMAKGIARGCRLAWNSAVEVISWPPGTHPAHSEASVSCAASLATIKLS